MKKFLFGLPFFFPALLSPLTLAEEKEDKFFLSVGGGYQFPSVTTIKAPVSGTDYKLDYEFDGSKKFDLGIGYDFGQWKLHGGVTKGTLSLDSIKLDGTKLPITIEDIDITIWGLSAIYEFTKESKFSPFLMSGISYQSGTDAVALVETGGETTSFTVSGDEVWGLQLGGGIFYELKEKIDIYTRIGTVIPLSNSNLPPGWTEDNPLEFGYNAGLIYYF